MDENTNVTDNNTASAENSSTTTPQSSPFDQNTFSSNNDTTVTPSESQPTANVSQQITSAFSLDPDANRTGSNTQTVGLYTPSANTDTTYYNNNQSSTASKPSSGFGITSLIMGILSILTSCCCGAGILFGILGFIFSLLQKKDFDGKKPGTATAGLITSIIGLLLSIGLIVLSYAGLLSLDPSSWSDYL